MLAPQYGNDLVIVLVTFDIDPNEQTADIASCALYMKRKHGLLSASDI